MKEFDQVKDSVARVSLPQHLKLVDSSAGIKAESKPTLKIISKTARIAETGFKILSTLTPTNSNNSDTRPDSVTVSQDNLGALFTLFAAQMQFLQQEYANIVVKNTFDEETSRLFRQFENHTSAFSSSQLANVRVAAELAAVSSRQNRRRGREDRGSFSGGFQRGTTAFRRNFSRRPGIYYPATPNPGFPNNRPDSDRHES